MQQKIICSITQCEHNYGANNGHDYAWETTCHNPATIVIDPTSGCQSKYISEEGVRSTDKTCKECGLQNPENCNTCMNIPPEPDKITTQNLKDIDAAKNDFDTSFGMSY